MSWQTLLVEFLLIAASVIPEEINMITAQSSPSSSQTTGLAQSETTVTSKVAPANLTQTTSQAVLHEIVNTTVTAARTFVTSELPTDHIGIHMAIKTTKPAQRTISKSEASSSQKTTIPAVSSTTGNAAKTAAKTTDKQTAQLTTVKTTNLWVHSNGTSVHAQRKTTDPKSTAPVGPVLTPKPSPATTGAYSVTNGTTQCIKAQIGLTMVVKNSQAQNHEYLNVDPNITHTTGVCGNEQASITISFQGGFIRFHFTKNGEIYFVSVIEASLTVPSEGSPYSGIKTEQLFETPLGNCFKCFSKQTVDLASDFQLWMVNSQLQAFDIVGNQFGKENECALDRNKTAIPIAVGFSLAGLLLIIFVTRVIYKRKPYRGYDRI